MMHKDHPRLKKSADSLDATTFDAKSLKSLLGKFMQECMDLIAARRENLFSFSELMDKYNEKKLKKRFKMRIADLKRGYTNSSHLISFKQYTPCQVGHVPCFTYPDTSYLLAEGKNPTDALDDLLYRKDVFFIIDDMIALTIAMYYAILKVLQKTMGENEGRELFNKIFSLQAKMFISACMPNLGDRITCVTQAGITVPINPISYFLRAGGDVIEESDIACHLNYPEYKIKHPLGGYYSLALMCISSDSIPTFLNLYFKKPYTENEIVEFETTVYDQERPKWMSGKWINELMIDKRKFREAYPEKITESTPKPPGFQKQLHLQFNTEMILRLIRMPKAVIEKMKVFFMIEQKAIEEIRLSNIRVRSISAVTQMALSRSLSTKAGNLKSLVPKTTEPLVLNFTYNYGILPEVPVIYEDDLAKLEKKKFESFDIALSHYKDDRILEAVVPFTIFLKQARAIYHYHQRLNHSTQDLYEAEKQIAVGCYNLSAALRELHRPETALPYLDEANEICEGLGIDEPFVEFIKKDLADTSLQLRTMKLEKSMTTRGYVNTNMLLFSPAQSATSGTIEQDLHRDYRFGL